MSKQQRLFPKNKLAYGGSLLKKRKNRIHGRPLAHKKTMHMVLRSSSARNDWSFWRPKNKVKIENVVTKFSRKYHVDIKSWSNNGNHLHFHLKLARQHLYAPFIRALTAAITMAITGASRMKKLTKKFWDYRPYTDIITTPRHYANIVRYIDINEWEATGLGRDQARFVQAWFSADGPANRPPDLA